MSLRDHYLLAIHENGVVSCYTHDLEKQEWTEQLEKSSPKRDAREICRITHAALSSVQSARKALLKDREDISATLDVDPDNAGGSLLALLSSTPSAETSTDESLQISIYQVRTKQPISSGTMPRPRLHQLLSYTLPVPRKFPVSKADFRIHMASGFLYQQNPNGMIIYNLSGPNPCITQAMDSNQQNLGSCMRLSSSLLAISTNSSISVINVPYGSLQCSQIISGSQGSESASQSPKLHSHQTPNEDIRLLSYFSRLDLLVALRERSLVVLPLTISPLKGPSGKRKRGGLLIDSLARGSAALQISPGQDRAKRRIKAFGYHLAQADQKSSCSIEDREIDDLLERGDIRGFDSLMTTKLGTTNPQGSHVDHHTLSYVISKIFQVSDETVTKNSEVSESVNRLAVRIWPTETCDWLMRQGLLTVDRIATSLRHYQILAPDATLATGTLIDALTQWDSSLDLLRTMTESRTPMSPVELAHALLQVVHRIKSEESDEGTKLLTNGEPQLSPQIEDKTSFHEEGEQQMQTSLSPKHASRELLATVLQRLCASSSYSLTHALKQTFSRSLLRSLADILRMEIAHNGWLSTYEDDVGMPDTAARQDAQITPISHVLNSLLDSLGPMGWVLGSSMTDDLTGAADTISYMKAEISAALEGVEEAAYLKGVLGEMLLCGRGALKPPSKKSLTHTNDPTDNSQYAKPTKVALGNDEGSRMLPLGLKLKPVIPMTKVATGGEVIARSKRDVGRLKSKMVGKYSFERIVV